MKIIRISLIAMFIFSCEKAEVKKSELVSVSSIDSLLQTYITVDLSSDLISQLSDNEKKMIPLLIDVAKIMDDLFWKQSYGDKNELLSQIKDPKLKKYLEINYGPWDRLNNNLPFLQGYPAKLDQAQFYPADMTKDEFSAANITDKTSLYTVLRRDDAKKLISIPYNEFYGTELKHASDLLLQAADLAEDAGLKNYLKLRAEAFRSNNYFQSDLAWMEMKSNTIDFVVGPIENYEDKLFGYKAAFEAYVLIKDLTWSKKLSRYAELLPALQKGLPVDAQYKKENPGSDSELNAYDVVYYAGDCNSGSKTIAINLPNDEEVQKSKGSRRLQLKNAMKAKYEKIMLPIANILIAEDQRHYLSFNAFFANTMFHEVAHGLGIKNTLDGKGTVRQALKEQSSALEEGKADILGLYMIHKLIESKEYSDSDFKENVVTFMAGIFRSIRFGGASAHGKANLLRYYFFKEMGAFSQDSVTGLFRVNFDKMILAMNALSQKILVFQGDGDYEGVKKWVETSAVIDPELQKELDRLKIANIPVDIDFNQGLHVLNLN